MTRPYHTIVITLLLFSSLVILSGCANPTHFGGSARNVSSGVEETALNDETDQDLQSSEPEMCLDQELNALGLTGMWNGPYLPMSFDPTIDATFDFPVVLNNQVKMYLDFFQNRFRDQFAMWLRRAAIYAPMMEAALAEAGLPRDLVYLAMIESGYNPFACSRSMAVGLWQFMEPTGLQYNLTINPYIDERRDPEKSTQAAVAFLSDLYKEFGDWHLAVAAYNGGPGKVRNGLNKFKVNTFWDLAEQDYLALETKRYVPKLIATLIIAKNPQKFGFTDLQPFSPPKVDLLRTPPGLGLDAIGLLTNTPKERIKQLNPELRQDKTPPNSTEYQVKVPFNTAALAMKNMSRLHAAVNTSYKTHKIRKGDTLASICAKYDVNNTTLLKANNLRTAALTNGQNLRIPYSVVSYQLLPENVAKTRATSGSNVVMHQVKAGETISRIAKLYNVSPELVMSWNDLKNVSSLKVGAQLAMYPNRQDTLATIAQFEPSPAGKAVGPERTSKLVLKADKRKTHITEVRGGEAFASYNVQNGDTLYTISLKVNASTNEIKKWNNLKSDTIFPGDVLKLKKA
jgi:membrane-bound lytic murein transglycosylase D